jgi:hypothetical protein
MAVRWHFVEGYEGDFTYWSWRVLNPDGTVESQSQSFSTYGAAVNEAIRNGFQPRQQHWIVATRHAITNFRPGKPPLTVPVVGEWLQATPTPNTRRTNTPRTDSRARPRRSEDPDALPSFRPRGRR